ncbi:PucR family transcriptional regulator [Microbacterium mitrae]|uniref:PucR family transcriptional regulator n=1 Tax=Microbacterium mitrae TaxID=664640 RepID=A0A5C8HMT2_9MICO|nr:PucR family transcriptional regulator [Microbacterium mitrae]TXK03000.1 PucR family transcriptional regulator [Microbacterium mitrae]
MPSSPSELTPTLRALLDRPALGLRLVGSAGDVPDGALDRTLRWVHTTDLADPTPFLADDLLLLTTGTQFATGTMHEAQQYVQRLASRGVAGLGFGTEVVRNGVPPALAEACAQAGLPLFEVPYRTPFIAIARANAEAVAAQAYARRSWALDAQRAISLAALRPDGLGATVAELARQLGAWVALFDAAGTMTRESPMGALSAQTRAAVDDEVAAVLRRGARAGSALAIDDQPFTLQTLGRGGHLRGVIAIASAELDQEGRGVVTSVIAMAGLALEQHQSLGRSRAALRGGLIDALHASHTAFVRRVVRSSGDALPPAPVIVAAAKVPSRLDAVTEWLELRGAEARGSVFFGRHEGDLVVIVPADDPTLVRELAARFDLTVGLSDPSDYDGFADALAQARLARDRGTPGINNFADTQASGVLSTLGAESRVVANGVLAPLIAADENGASELMRTVRTYLECNGSAEATATALGVHRHTVRARMKAAERALGLSLETFAARAELWAAFMAHTPPTRR